MVQNREAASCVELKKEGRRKECSVKAVEVGGG
jgi:hypothetical protein